VELALLVAIVSIGSEGDLDSTFSSDGIVTADLSGGSDIGRSLAIQFDVKIVVAGQTYNGTGAFTIMTLAGLQVGQDEIGLGTASEMRDPDTTTISPGHNSVRSGGCAVMSRPWEM